MQLKKSFLHIVHMETFSFVYVSATSNDTHKYNQHIYLKQTHMPTLLNLLECMIRHLVSVQWKDTPAERHRGNSSPFLRLMCEI